MTTTCTCAPLPEPPDDNCPTHGEGSPDWPEDAAHENGNYECRCSKCGVHFIGHKRRTICRLCATSQN